MAAGQGTYDVIVVGIGGMGSTTAWQLARRGQRVLGLERFDIGHGMGSSHGHNRIIRRAYFENPRYVPLLDRAYALWREAERAWGEQLLFVTGGLDAGPENSRVVQGSLASCREHGLAHDVLTAGEVARRFPGWRLAEDHIAVYQADAGFVASERSILAHVSMAIAAGADIRAREKVLAWEPTATGVRVTTERGVYEAGRLVLSAGAWIGDFVPSLAAQVVPERQVLGWFRTSDPSLFALERFPVGILSDAAGHFYVFPQWGIPGFKIGLYHHLHETGHADTLSREPTARDEAVLRDGVRRFFPAADGPVLALKACLFTNTPDEHFIIDRLPDLPQVIVASPCSGHGFKFASVVGEVLADLAMDRRPAFDLSLFALERLTATA
ncbi:N-methyl-L-tryptophan oxidase [Chelatococcus sp. SYSU_G07232]|uniref:N-methyl-L-tryptophan oxidase n=1 Tax=Chelatococcus albus TaxID=3047466 RepID=A0ABT7AKD7_9HYPH|nr:N-methyl-L-tryptophan oxidase [Chelatococcus sp. SYSU_G07232]MDJ1159818.1 N-methyl-L-tryptophan oxidase [Chelatococcus sp. SYSU_G07232]